VALRMIKFQPLFWFTSHSLRVCGLGLQIMYCLFLHLVQKKSKIFLPFFVDSSIYNILVGLDRTIYIRCVYGIFGREITIYTVIFGVYIRFWPTLRACYTS